MEEHGFRKTVKEFNIWELVLKREGNKDKGISLLVNPYATKCEENEMVIYAYHDEDDEDGMDMSTRIDIVFEMIADGTIEYIKENK